jgi:hypothetical protein
LRDPRPWILETELAKRAGRSATRSAAPPSPQV